MLFGGSLELGESNEKLINDYHPKTWRSQLNKKTNSGAPGYRSRQQQYKLSLLKLTLLVEWRKL